MRILTATPKVFLTVHETDSSFFSRDMGLTCRALREAGCESRVVMPEGPEARAHPDVIRGSMSDLESADWWARLNPDAVVLCAWAAPRYTPVARAIRESGALLIARCDSGEPFSQWQKTLRQSFRTHYLAARYEGRSWAWACGYSLLKTPLFYLPFLYDHRVVEHLAQAHLILSETPDIARSLGEFLRGKGRPELAGRVRCVPHPIMDGAGISGEAVKLRRILSVGRWDHYSKNAPLLIRSLGRVLALRSDYEAHLYGGGDDVLRALVRRLPEAVRSRIVVRGRVDHEVLLSEYRNGRIFFAPSRSESFNMSAAEALCAGCSVVGSGHISSFRYFASKNSGTPAARYTVASMAEALDAEIEHWETGGRDPAEIGRLWREEVCSTSVAARILEAVQAGVTGNAMPAGTLST